MGLFDRFDVGDEAAVAVACCVAVGPCEPDGLLRQVGAQGVAGGLATGEHLVLADAGSFGLGGEALASADLGRVDARQPDGFGLAVPAHDDGVAVDDAQDWNDVGIRRQRGGLVELVAARDACDGAG